MPVLSLCFQAIAHCDLAALAPQGSALCGPGWGLAAGPKMSAVAASCTRTNTVTVWTLRRGGSLTPLHTIGRDAEGRVEFSFGGALGGGLCFTPPMTYSPVPSLLVADTGNNRVVEVEGFNPIAGQLGTLKGKTILTMSKEEAPPRSVAASAVHIAVCVWSDRRPGQVPGFTGVVLYNSLTRARLRRVATASFPVGIRLSSQGPRVCVSDMHDGRVLSTCHLPDGYRDGEPDRLLRRSDVNQAFDVEEVEGGWLVPCHTSGRVVFMSSGGVSREEQEAGPVLGVRLLSPTSLALLPGVGLVVRDGHAGGTVHVFQ
jgi:hypothetical protein